MRFTKQPRNKKYKSFQHQCQDQTLVLVSYCFHIEKRILLHVVWKILTGSMESNLNIYHGTLLHNSQSNSSSSYTAHPNFLLPNFAGCLFLTSRWKVLRKPVWDVREIFWLVKHVHWRLHFLGKNQIMITPKVQTIN